MSKNKKNNGVPSPTDLDNEQKEKTVLVILDKTTDLKKMTPKQQKLAVQMTAYPEKKNIDKCLDAGYQVEEGSNVSSIMAAMTGKLADSLEAHGITTPRICQVISEGFLAETIHIVKTSKRDGDGKVTGEDIHTFSTPDHRTRKMYVDLAIKLRGEMPSAKLDISGEIDHTHKAAPITELYKDIPVPVLRKLREMRLKEIDEAEFEVVGESVA